MDPFIGEIIMFGGNFAPRGWALCDGQLLAINSNSALFSILGTTYGGDGVSTFGLPDLRGRVAMHAGTGPGLSPRALGARGGQEQVVLTTAQIPAHRHDVEVTESAQPGNDRFGGTDSGGGGGTEDKQTGDTGGGQPHENMQPYQVVNYIIALQGTYPSRS